MCATSLEKHGSKARCCHINARSTELAQDQKVHVRIATWIDPDVNHRLRLAALLRKKRLSSLLTELLDGSLPSTAELTEQLGRVNADANG